MRLKPYIHITVLLTAIVLVVCAMWLSWQAYYPHATYDLVMAFFLTWLSERL